MPGVLIFGKVALHLPFFSWTSLSTLGRCHRRNEVH